MQHWEKGLRPGIVKGRWTEDEDRVLVFLVSQGHKNWGRVAENMPGRTSKQCRERWNNYLDPTLVHTPFTEEEDSVLLHLHKEHGNKWAYIARLIPGRTENAVKLRFNSLMKNAHLLTSTRLVSEEMSSFVLPAAVTACTEVGNSTARNSVSNGNTAVDIGGDNDLVGTNSGHKRNDLPDVNEMVSRPHGKYNFACWHW
jgi:hypothetical protein